MLSTTRKPRLAYFSNPPGSHHSLANVWLLLAKALSLGPLQPPPPLRLTLGSFELENLIIIAIMQKLLVLLYSILIIVNSISEAVAAATREVKGREGSGIEAKAQSSAKTRKLSKNTIQH